MNKISFSFSFGKKSLNHTYKTIKKNLMNEILNNHLKISNLWENSEGNGHY